MNFEKTKKTKFMLIWRTLALIILLVVSCILVSYVIQNKDYSWDTIAITLIFLIAFFSMFVYVFFINLQKFKVFFIRKKDLLLQIAEEKNFIIVKDNTNISIIVKNYLFTTIENDSDLVLKKFLKNNFIIVKVNECTKQSVIKQVNDIFNKTNSIDLSLDFLIK